MTLLLYWNKLLLIDMILNTIWYNTGRHILLITKKLKPAVQITSIKHQITDKNEQYIATILLEIVVAVVVQFCRWVLASSV